MKYRLHDRLDIYDKVDDRYFEPVKVGNITFKNRFIIPAMSTKMSRNEQVNANHIIHYGALARGGASLVIVEATAVEPRGMITDNDLVLDDELKIKGFKKLTHVIRGANSISAIQLNHAGRKSRIDNINLIGPSKLPHNSEFNIPKEMDISEINYVARKFANSAVLAKEANFDMIEIHAAHGYLIHQFMSKKSNIRNDKFKASNEFLKVILQEIRKVCDLPIIIKVSATDYDRSAITIQNTIDMLTPIRNMFDFISVSSGGINDTKIPQFPGHNLDYATILKSFVKKPVIINGLMHDPVMIEHALCSEKTDFISIGRKCLENPNYVNMINPRW